MSLYIAPEPDDRITRSQVLESIGHLQVLAECWEPCGGLIEDARMALAGEAGLSDMEFRKLRVWSARWRALDPRLRQLYTTHPTSIAVQSALWAILGARQPCAPDGREYGILSAYWLDAYGYTPSIELVPYYDIRRLIP